MPFHPLDYIVVLGASVWWGRSMLSMVRDALDELI